MWDISVNFVGLMTWVYLISRISCVRDCLKYSPNKLWWKQILLVAKHQNILWLEKWTLNLHKSDLCVYSMYLYISRYACLCMYLCITWMIYSSLVGNILKNFTTIYKYSIIILWLIEECAWIYYLNIITSLLLIVLVIWPNSQVLYIFDDFLEGLRLFIPFTLIIYSPESSFSVYQLSVSKPSMLTQLT